MSRRAWLAAVATIGVVALAIFEAAGVAAASISVAAVNFEFKPSSSTVHIGDTVVWTMSGDGHTVRSGTIDANNVGQPSDGPLNSGFKGPGDSYSFTFTQAGTYTYFCEIHADAGMKGTITVIAAPASASPTSSGTPVVTPASPTSTASIATQATVTPSGAGNGAVSASDSTLFIAGGILIAIAILAVTVARARRKG